MQSDRISSLLKSADRNLSFITRTAPPSLKLSLDQDSRIAEMQDAITALTTRLEHIMSTRSSDSTKAALAQEIERRKSQVKIFEQRLDSLENEVRRLNASLDEKLKNYENENLSRMEGLAKAVGQKIREVQDARNKLKAIDIVRKN